MTDILSKKLNFPCWDSSVIGKIHVAWYKNIKLFYCKLNTLNMLILLLLTLTLRQMALSKGILTDFLLPIFHPFHITTSQTPNIKQIIDATKNPVRDEIPVENSRKSVRIPSGMTLY
jgi:hypothetical protein